MLRAPLRLALLAALAAALCCGKGDDAAPEDRDGAHFPLPPAQLEPLLAGAPFEIRDHEWMAGWRVHVYRIEADFPSLEDELDLKWKAAPPGLEERNNTPRREIAAYRIQQWFLDPADYVVPTTVGRCLPLAQHHELEPGTQPNLPDARCVFGALAVWLQAVEPPEPRYEAERFERDALYAKHLGHYNLLTYLIDNRDTRPANVLVASDDSDRRVFSIDNGVSFGETFYNALRSHWNEIRVPALPREALDRLRRVDEQALAALSVVAEYEMDDEGVFVPRPTSEPFAPEKPVRLRNGVLQIGLTPAEIDGVRERLRALLGRADAGEIAYLRRPG